MLTKSRSLPLAMFAVAAVALLIAGCSLPQAQPDLTRYYVLTAPMNKVTAPESKGARVSLRAVHVPGFLHGKAMQVRVASNELNFSDESRWAESLESGIGRVLRESLEGRSGIGHVVASPVEEHDYDIVVNVLRCEGDRAAGVARFTAAVEIYTTQPGGARVARDTFTTEVAGWDRQSYGQLAQKLSEAIDAFAGRIGELVAERGGAPLGFKT